MSETSAATTGAAHHHQSWFAGGLCAMAVLVRAARLHCTACLMSPASGRGVCPAEVQKADLARAGRRLRERSAAHGSARGRARADLTGRWAGDNGLTYRFDQFGDEVVFEEITPIGVTAFGLGRVEACRVWVGYETVDGSAGELRLHLRGDMLTGGFLSYDTGAAAPVEMRPADVLSGA